MYGSWGGVCDRQQKSCFHFGTPGLALFSRLLAIAACWVKLPIGVSGCLAAFWFMLRGCGGPPSPPSFCSGLLWPLLTGPLLLDLLWLFGLVVAYRCSH